MSVKRKVRSVARELRDDLREVKRDVKAAVHEVKNESSKSSDDLVGGLILVSIGLVLLVTNYYGWASLWPLVFMIPISVLIIVFIKDRDNGVIIPLTILSVIMLLFLSITLGVFNWSDLSWLWPVFIIAPGLGLLFFYLANGLRESALLIPISILLGLGLLFMLGIWMYWPVILIIVGAAILLKSRKE